MIIIILKDDFYYMIWILIRYYHLIQLFSWFILKDQKIQKGTVQPFTDFSEFSCFGPQFYFVYKGNKIFTYHNFLLNFKNVKKVGNPRIFSQKVFGKNEKKHIVFFFHKNKKVFFEFFSANHFFWTLNS